MCGYRWSHRARTLNRCGVLLAPALFLLASCDGAPAGAPGPVVSDSAGVRIVRYAGQPRGTHSLTLSPEPVLRFGHAPGDYTFQTISEGLLQPNGGAVVADRGSSEVVRVAADGRSWSVLARSGQGPREVRLVRSIVRLGQDSLLVEDDGNGKIMRFQDGALVGSVSTARDASLTRGLMARGIDGDDGLLMVTGSYQSRFDEPWLSGHMVRFDLTSLAVDTVGTFDMASRVPPNGPANPFGPFGEASVTGGLFVHGRTDLPELTWRAPDGSARQILRWAPEPAQPTQQDFERFAARLRADLARVNPDMSPEAVDQFTREQLARYELVTDQPMPLFARIHGDGAGGAWLSDFDPGASYDAGLRRYSVIAPDGTWKGTVRLPDRFRLLDVADGRVLGVLEDDLEVEGIAVYELRAVPVGP